MLRNIIDPNTVEDTGEPRGVEGLHIDASCSWVLAYDNLAKIREWLSNALCRIATGAAFTTRTFYTNRDREIFKARQPQIMNGISEVATRGDILDRALLVNLPVIEEYREEADVWAEFHEAHPGILGALLDATSAGLKSIESGEAIADKLPRLADFARWAIRTEEALGGKRGDFMRAHTDSKYDATATVLDAEPISHRLYQFARTFSEDAAWVGTGRQLLDILNEHETDDREDPARPLHGRGAVSEQVRGAAAQERPRDAEQHRAAHPHRIRSGVQQAGDGARDQSEHRPADDHPDE